VQVVGWAAQAHQHRDRRMLEASLSVLATVLRGEEDSAASELRSLDRIRRRAQR
jgi:hypothetical protein